MIKFFRKIRYDLMEKNKTGKYLKYAVGEIILVVIGILIALQINNWNEERKKFIKSKNYLSDIVKDLQSDSITLNRGIYTYTYFIEFEEWALKQSNYQPNQVDSLWICFGGFYFDIPLNDRTFQKIQNSGLIGLDSIYDDVTYYYTVSKKRIDSNAEWDKSDVTQRQNYMLDLQEHVEMSNYQLNLLSNGLIEQDFETRQDLTELTQLTIDFANSTRGRNHFKSNYNRHIRIRNSYELVKEENLNLLKKINQELKTLKK